MDVAAPSATGRPDVLHAAVYRPLAQHTIARTVQGQVPTQAPALFQARHPEQSLFYSTITDHFETWLALGVCAAQESQTQNQCFKSCLTRYPYQNNET